jgi:UDP-glucuronate 4-epimerase
MDDRALYFNSTIIHLAGIVGAANVEARAKEAYLVNVTKTLEFAEKSLEAGISKFVFASTSHVYEQTSDRIAEDYLIGPQNRYAEQKYEAETKLNNLFSNSTVELSIVRIFSVLDWDCKDFTLGGLIRKIAGGDTTSVVYNGDDERDFLTPKTIADSLEKIATKDGMAGIWNLSSGKRLTVRAAALSMLSDVVGETAVNRIVPGQSSSPSVVGDNQKLCNALPGVEFNWAPSMYRDEVR